MDIQQAKVILSNFRPEGQDAEDSDFAAALALAAQDRGLGEWLASERAKDATFSAALNSIHLPEDLRAEILAALNGDVVIEEDPELDDAFFEAFAEVTPPDGLREEIVLAMQQEQNVVKVNFLNWGKMTYVAAAIVALLAIFIFAPGGGPTGENKRVEKSSGETQVHAYDIQQTVGMKLVRDDIKLVSNSFKDSMKWLEDKQLPIPEVPHKLRLMDCLGVTMVDIGEGAQASLVRFRSSDNKEVNMLVIARENVANADNLPDCSKSSLKDSYWCPNCDYWIARMQSEDTTIILLSETEPGEHNNLLE